MSVSTNGQYKPHNPAPAAAEEKIHLDKPGLWTIKVTPEIAYEWLTKNYKQNRRIRPIHVAYLADEIRNGRWQEDHPEAILFADDGEMMEGQHRLTAVVEADIPVKMRVETGVRKSIYPYLDSGLVRSLEDRVRFTENSNQNRVIVMLLNFYYARSIGDGSVSMKGRHSGSRQSRGGTKRLSPELAYEIYKKHKKALHWAAQAHKVIRGVGRITVLGACAEYYEKKPEKANEFAATLYSQDGNGPVLQARVLRDAILRKMEPGKTMVGGTDNYLYGMTVSALKAYDENRHPSRIVPSEW